MLARCQGLFGGLKMPGIRRGDADHVNAMSQEQGNGIRPRKAGEVRYAAGGLALVMLGARAGSTGDRSQANVDESKIAAIQSLGMKLLEERPIRLFEDHSQADHAGSYAMMVQIHRGPHALHLNRDSCRSQR